MVLFQVVSLPGTIIQLLFRYPSSLFDVNLWLPDSLQSIPKVLRGEFTPLSTQIKRSSEPFVLCSDLA